MEVLDVCIILISAFSPLTFAGHNCETYLDCKSCVHKRSLDDQNCMWCPLSRSCHKNSSKTSPCLYQHTVHIPNMCTEEKHGSYNKQAAFSNVLMSAAAYADDPQLCLKKIYPESDFSVDKVIEKKCEDLPLFKYAKCLAYTAVSHSQGIILLAYRGTLVNNTQIYDEIFSVLTIPKTPFPAGGKIQHYFANAYEKLSGGVNESISDLVRKYPAYDVVVTGHSLGGALASLAAMSLVYQKLVPGSKMALYTYGLPRVGDKTYALSHDKLVTNSWRVVHYRDIVSHVPFCNLPSGCSVHSNGPYHHGTEIFYPEKNMSLESKYIVCKGDEDMNCSDGLITKRPCLLDLLTCIKYHKQYFEVSVGNIC